MNYKEIVTKVGVCLLAFWASKQTAVYLNTHYPTLFGRLSV